MSQETWKVGELAEQTGLSVRTLHYYDEIGLLTPSRRTAAGHRLYAPDDVMRLQQIKSMRQLGFPLEEIRDLLTCDDYPPERVIRLHIERLREQIAAQQGLCNRLETIATRLDSKETVSVEQFIQTIQEIDMVDKFSRYYTPEQLAYLEERGREVGEQRIREVEKEWPALIAEVRAEMQKGTDPSSERMQQLARRWQGLIDEFTGGNKEIEAALANMYRQDPNIAADKGYTPDRDMSAYVGKALRAAADS